MLRARLQNGTYTLASMHNCINTEVRFRALLTEDGARVLFHREAFDPLDKTLV